ncbi:MAG: hypothetical protein K2X99_05030 [Gemmatimonadaceae bacterium]|nr:hypothetical protein [Gemmatimonadaceae bacterium]
MTDGALATRLDLVDETVTVGAHRFVLAKPRQADALISEEDFARDERLPYWAELWPSALVLAAQVARAPIVARSIELGCGLALPSLVTRARGGAVTATDYYDDALLLAARNADRNGIGALETALVDWNAIPATLGRYDRILAADVLYERRYGPLVAGAIDRLLAPSGCAWLTDPGRVGREPFMQAAAACELRVTVLDAPPVELTQGGAVTLYELRRAGADR